ncbi:hypothetical protein [Streptomyces sp. NPDC054940]
MADRGARLPYGDVGPGLRVVKGPDSRPWPGSAPALHRHTRLVLAAGWVADPEPYREDEDDQDEDEDY